MSCYVTFGGYRCRKRVARHIVKWFLEYRKLSRFNTFVHIIDKRLWGRKMDGCIHTIDQLKKPRFFEIEIENRLSLDEYITTLIHELIHFEQRLRGEHQVSFCPLTTKMINKWHGKELPPLDYCEEPWEIDAYQREKVYFAKYKEYATNH
mgnify:FL=1